MRDLGRLIIAWIRGRYRTVPWRSIAILGVVVLYMFSPIDLIPDYIPFVGVVDDLAVMGFLIQSLRKDVQRFKAWEAHVASKEVLE
jgi:uncharacterized membrane protein YkvA (DUF1232 family)